MDEEKDEGGRMKDESQRDEYKYDLPQDTGREIYDPEGTYRDLRERTMDFGLRIIRMYCALPKTDVARVLGRQVLRSGTSVGAHYREASRARSDAEFISKIEGGLQELDETEYWLQLIVRSEVSPPGRVADLIQETNELMAIFTTCVKNAKRRNDR